MRSRQVFLGVADAIKYGCQPNEMGISAAPRLVRAVVIVSELAEGDDSISAVTTMR